MTYERIEDRGAYKIITRVNEKGDYTAISIFNDGMTTSFCKNNIYAMGWQSLTEFFKYRKGFKRK